MNDPDRVIHSPKRDRLAAFFEVFRLEVIPVQPGTAAEGPLLFVTAGRDGRPATLVFRARGRDRALREALIAARVEFENATNPLMHAMPERLAIELGALPALRDTAAAFLAEATENRCGRTAALNRLAEVMVLMILRHAIDQGATRPGLLAGLAHPALHRALVAMHEGPARDWRIEELAETAGMSRSAFMALFRQKVGTTPMAYLAAWRLALGHRNLAAGEAVKAVARRVGFGSAAAFSRAFSRRYGYPPVAVAARPAATSP